MRLELEERDPRDATCKVLRVGLGIVFLWASWDKILHPAAFAQIVANYALLPEWLIPAAALMLPWVEAICGLFLVVGLLPLGALMIANLLMVLFIGALVINMVRGVDLACGCFSASNAEESGGYVWNLTRDMLILTPGLWVLYHEMRKENMAPDELVP